MFIQTEETPNPAALKFLPSREILGAGSGGPMHIASAAQAAVSPLAEALFGISGVRGVLLGSDFITVVCGQGVSWDTLKPQVISAMLDHFASGMPMLLEIPTAKAVEPQPSSPPPASYDEKDAEIVAQIKDLLDDRVRPAVARDGGDITFHSFKNGVVYLAMRGACSGCPRSTATLKMGIEGMLKHYVPEVAEVRQIAMPSHYSEED